MPVVSFSGIIDRPVATVFAFVTDPATHPRWQRSVAESELVSAPPVSVGSVGREVRKFMGKAVETTFRVTEFVPNLRFLSESITGPVPGEIGADFEALDEQRTRVTLSAAFSLTGPFKMAGPLVNRVLKAETEANFKALKELLEA